MTDKHDSELIKWAGDGREVDKKHRKRVRIISKREAALHPMIFFHTSGKHASNPNAFRQDFRVAIPWRQKEQQHSSYEEP